MAIVDLEVGLSDEAQAARDTAHKFAEEVLRPAGTALDKLADPADVIAPGSVLWDVFGKYRQLGFDELDSGESDLDRIPRPLPADGTRLTTVHLSSSCPMGENRKRSAVDSFGKVHDLERLHVADASLLCGAPGANPQGTIMAVARRNAFRFLGRL